MAKKWTTVGNWNGQKVDKGSSITIKRPSVVAAPCRLVELAVASSQCDYMWRFFALWATF